MFASFEHFSKTPPTSHHAWTGTKLKYKNTHGLPLRKVYMKRSFMKATSLLNTTVLYPHVSKSKLNDRQLAHVGNSLKLEIDFIDKALRII